MRGTKTGIVFAILGIIHGVRCLSYSKKLRNMNKYRSHSIIARLMLSLKKQALLLLASLFFLIQVYSQITADVTAILSRSANNENFYWPTELYDQQNFNYDSSKPYKGIPGNLTSYIIKTFDLQPAQGCYEFYKRLKGQIPLDVLKKLLKDRNFNIEDTSKLSLTPIKHFISFIVGYDSKNRITIIGDANNNHDFSDDTIFRCNRSMLSSRTTKAKLQSWIDEYKYQYAYDGNIIERQVLLRLNPIPVSFTYADSIQQALYVMVVSNEGRKAKIALKKGNVFLTISHSRTDPVRFDGTSRIIVEGQSKYFYYTPGDSLYLYNKLYHMDRISSFGDTLYLKYVKNYKKRFGIYPGDYALNIESVDMQTKGSFDLSRLAGKYVLLDFWGSWCKPCIAAIPDLVKFSKLYDSSILSIVSIAEDSLSKIKSLKKIIKNNNMNWTHLLEDIQIGLSKGIALRFKVYSYPTQILINPEGKIIFRSDGENKLTTRVLKNLLMGRS